MPRNASPTDDAPPTPLAPVLVVVSPFGSYAIGSRIVAADEIEAAQRDYPTHVMRAARMEQE
jgi:hypothetical protein